MALNKVCTSLQFVKASTAPRKLEPASETVWAPNTDVYVTDRGMVIKVELAGMRREDLELTVDGHQLCIRGQRPDGCRAGQCRFLVMEINYGAFESVIELPAGYELAQAKATYQNGFLRIDVPLAAGHPTEPRMVPITGE
jgi:HSP20 family protein